jgi:ATP-dependent RNA helicase DDX56/DBP9
MEWLAHNTGNRFIRFTPFLRLFATRSLFPFIGYLRNIMASDGQKTWIQRDFGLDKRLVKALSKMGFIYPTPVQAQCIPVAMQGRDVLVKSRTGSGKTAAFSLPLLHKILLSKSSTASAGPAAIRGVILAPTKELCRQIERHINELIYYCKDQISVFSLSDDNSAAVTYRLQGKPDVIVATPAKLLQQINANTVDLSSIEILVIDEADLVLSFGYAEDVQLITARMPKIFQGLLMSATLSPELDKFKRVVLHNPAVLKVAETKGSGHLLQFYLECSQADKFLILYVFIKMGLLQGKGLIFVNDVNKCYKLKLFLQQMFIPAAVLNSEVPLNSRLHILDVSWFMLRFKLCFPSLYLLFPFAGV